MEPKKLEDELRDIYKLAVATRDAATETMSKILALKAAIQEDQLKAMKAQLKQTTGE